MNQFFVELFAKRIPISSDAFVVYYTMRSDVFCNRSTPARVLKSEGILVSGLSVQSIAEISNLTTYKVNRAVEELTEIQWLKVSAAGFELGKIVDSETVWFCEKSTDDSETEEDCDTLQAIRQMAKPVDRHLKKSKRRLASGSMGGLLREEKASKKLLEFYIQKCVTVSDEPPVLDHRTKYVFANRVLKYSDEDLAQAKDLIDWAFKNWAELKVVFRQVDDAPSLNTLATKSVIDALTKFKETGIPTRETLDKIDHTGMANRADKKQIDQAKDEGW